MIFLPKSLSDRVIRLFSVLIFLVGFMNADDSGKVRLNLIMNSQKNGFIRSVPDIRIAKTENVAKDLNTSAIADYFPTKTCFGRMFLDEALSKPRLGDALQTVVLPRQRAIKVLVENPALMTEVNTLLERVHQEEEYILTLLSDTCKRTLCPEQAVLEQQRIEGSWFYPIKRFTTLNPTFNVAAYVARIGAMVGATVKIGGWAKIMYDNYLPPYNPARDNFDAYKHSLLEFHGALRNIGEKCFTPTAYLFYNFYTTYRVALSKQRLLCSMHTLIEAAEKLRDRCCAQRIA